MEKFSYPKTIKSSTALPYLYIPCPELVIQNTEEGRGYIHVLSLAIEKALSVKSNSTSKQQHVHGCSIVRGKHIYGYYSSDELFVKIYLYPHSYFFNPFYFQC
ncbi:DNA-directed DNA polymerase protein [Dioscorea alata]|uniref:DNA-directed DNA polymerase protein n=1 Tax=Dioscorea alata TaxID=55571 RepID=A0ACB7W287_DIOAL|nr:DNA-directed DNA polymerase protein [Dioscorea alata]